MQEKIGRIGDWIGRLCVRAFSKKSKYLQPPQANKFPPKPPPPPPSISSSNRDVLYLITPYLTLSELKALILTGASLKNELLNNSSFRQSTLVQGIIANEQDLYHGLLGNDNRNKNKKKCDPLMLATSPTINIPFRIYDRNEARMMSDFGGGEPFHSLNKMDLNGHAVVHGMDPERFPYIAFLARDPNSREIIVHTIYRFPNSRRWHGLTEGHHAEPSDFTIRGLPRALLNAYNLQRRLEQAELKLDEAELKLEPVPRPANQRRRRKK